MSTADLASKVGALGPFMRNLQNAVEIVEAAHALEGDIKAHTQSIEALKAERQKMRDETEAERQARIGEAKAELEAVHAEAERERVSLVNAKAEAKRLRESAKADAEAKAAEAAARANEIIRQANEAIASVRADIASDTEKLKSLKADTALAEQAKAKAEAEYADTQKRIKTALGL